MSCTAQGEGSGPIYGRGHRCRDRSGKTALVGRSSSSVSMRICIIIVSFTHEASRRVSDCFRRVLAAVRGSRLGVGVEPEGADSKLRVRLISVTLLLEVLWI